MSQAETGAKEVDAATAERVARLSRAETLVKDHVLMSMAGGLVPLPAFDLAAGVAIQLALLKRLCTLYGVPFSEQVARGVVATVLGGIGAGALGAGLFLSAVKLVPGAGTFVGVLSMPIALGSVTYALGKMFVAHLELGGALLNFQPGADRGYLREMIQRGRRVAEAMRPSAGASREPAKP